MTEDEMQRKMEFIVEQQAQFAADIQVLQEKHNVLTDALTSVVGIVGKLAAGQGHTDAKMSELADAQKKLAEAQASTEERLNAFIVIVERHLTEGRNGNSGN